MKRNRCRRRGIHCCASQDHDDNDDDGDGNDGYLDQLLNTDEIEVMTMDD